ncbi:MAG TPA: hypothetical protein VLJ80_15085 [Solirubrobacteraceae bacterium]|nr:hypothetical protein [Solirubrobacteraceae bacterium]
MEYWLKSLGTTTKPMKDDWLNEAHRMLDFVTSRKRMAMRPGDKLALYATGHGSVFAVGTVTSFAFEHGEPGHEDFVWRVNVQLDQPREFIHEGVPLDLVSVDDRDLRVSIKQKSQIRLSSNEFEAIEASLQP